MDYECLQGSVRRLKARFPFLRVERIGKSLLGKELFLLELGEKREAVLFAGTFHGMESITSLILLRFARRMCYSWERGERFPRGLCILPCVNPDGMDIFLRGPEAAGPYGPLVREILGEAPRRWQANARGVDLNHNFDAGWQTLRRLETEAGILGPSATRYGGTGPESEPESAALARLCRENPFRLALALHSQGEEIYYEYGARTPASSRKMAETLAKLSGYGLSEPQGLASRGGFKDWFIDCFGRPGFTVEVGRGANPLPVNDFPEIYSRVEPLLLGALLL